MRVRETDERGRERKGRGRVGGGWVVGVKVQLVGTGGGVGVGGSLYSKRTVGSMMVL